MIKRRRITLGLSYAQAWIVLCDWCGRSSQPVTDYAGLQATLSMPDRFGHFFPFHKPGPDGKRHECHWCRWEREWQAELEAIRQRVKNEIEQEKRQARCSTPSEVHMEQTIRDAVADALGYEVPDAVITDALAELKGHATKTLKARLKKKEAAFEEAGGRGVDVADEIDQLRIVLAARRAKRAE